MKRLMAKIFRVFFLISCRFLTGIQARWHEKPNQKVKIYYANHSSHLDGLVIWSCFPNNLRQNIHPIAAKDYWAKTSFRHFIATQVFNAILISRNPTLEDNPLKTLKKLLSDQQSLILFPEGTRGDGQNMADFKGGLYHLAKSCPHVELVPVYLDNLNRVLPKGSKLIVPIICSAIFGLPITPLTKTETKAQFLTRAKQSLEELAL